MNNLVFDVDGVVLDYQSGYRDFVAQHTKGLLQSDKLSLPLPRDLEWRYINSASFGNIPPIIDPKEFNRLCAGAKVFFITNLPFELKQTRVQNLKNLGFKFEDLFIGGFETYGKREYPTKGEVLLKIIGRWKQFLFVDDYQENCDEVAMNFPKSKVFMLKGFYNFDIQTTRFEKINNWQKLAQEITNFRNPS